MNAHADFTGISRAMFPSDEVAAAVAEGRPVVALESALVTHGLPYPNNIEASAAMGAEVRARGAVPATVAVIDGILRVGLETAELERLATDREARKLSTRDLPLVVAAGLTGGTTVAATVMAAGAVGIRVMATGGIGGVHLGRRDVSSDLFALTRYAGVVVCSGPKSLLDLEATREALDTLGIPVVGYGADVMPGFYLVDSGQRVDARVDSPEHVAAMARARDALGMPSAILAAVPPPAEYALPSDELETAIAAASAQCAAEGVGGSDVTPRFLELLANATAGRTLTCNHHLLVRNASVAADVAVALA